MKLKKLALTVAAVMAAGSVFIGCNNMNSPKAYEQAKLNIEKGKAHQEYEKDALEKYYGIIDTVAGSINTGNYDANGKLEDSNKIEYEMIKQLVANVNYELEKAAKLAQNAPVKKITCKKTSDIAANAYKGKTGVEVKMDLEKNWFELK